MWKTEVAQNYERKSRLWKPIKCRDFEMLYLLTNFPSPIHHIPVDISNSKSCVTFKVQGNEILTIQ